MSKAKTGQLSSRVVRPGKAVVRLEDHSKRILFDPKTWSPKKRREAKDTYQQMLRIAGVSMVQIGEDEYRMPTRAERRRAGMRSRQKHVLSAIAQKKGLALMKKPIRVGPVNRDCDRRKNAREDRQYGAVA